MFVTGLKYSITLMGRFYENNNRKFINTSRIYSKIKKMQKQK